MATSKTKQNKPKGATSGKAKLAPPLPVTLIPVSKVDPSPVNRNADVDIDSLAASIKRDGLQEAIKVRPKADRFEIVFGERRWRAFRKLGLSDIPATIEDLDDTQAAAVQAAENLERTELAPLEEAELYERLLALRVHGKPAFTPETLAHEVANRSVGHIYNRLRLTALAPELRKALYDDKITLTGAFLIARGIPTALQAEAWVKIKQYQEEEADDLELDEKGRLGVVPLKSIIEHDYSSRLEHAPFSLKDAKLIPAAGTCEACAKRSGNQPFLFDKMDAKDTCTDLPCFKAKVLAFVAREKGRVITAGGTVLSDEDSRRVFNGGATLPFGSKWIDLDEVSYDDPKRRTWRKLLGDLCPAPTLAFTSQGRPKLLAQRAEVLATLKDNGLDPDGLPKAAPAGAASPSARPAHADDPEDDADDQAPITTNRTPAIEDERLKARLVRTTRERILAAIVAAAEAAGPDDNRFVQLALQTMYHGGYHNAVLDAAKRRLGSKRPKDEHPQVTISKHAATLSNEGIRGLLLELALARSGYYVSSATEYPRDLAQAIELYKIDAPAIEKAVADELANARAARLSSAKAGGT